MKATKIFTDTINGIDLSIIDEENSETPICVFRELKEDLFYGISNLDIKPEDTIIDVGANTGIFSIYAKKLYGCKIIAFEPVPANFENFKKNIVLFMIFPFVIAISFFLIADIDSPRGGVIRIEPRNLLELKNSLNPQNEAKASSMGTN